MNSYTNVGPLVSLLIFDKYEACSALLKAPGSWHSPTSPTLVTQLVLDLPTALTSLDRAQTSLDRARGILVLQLVHKSYFPTHTASSVSGLFELNVVLKPTEDAFWSLGETSLGHLAHVHSSITAQHSASSNKFSATLAHQLNHRPPLSLPPHQSSQPPTPQLKTQHSHCVMSGCGPE